MEMMRQYKRGLANKQVDVLERAAEDEAYQTELLKKCEIID